MTFTRPVFVVDDDQGIRSLLQTYLEQQGLDVVAFADGYSFLIRLRELGPDAVPAMIVLDVMLPDIDGFEIVKQVRGFSQVPIIMLTASAEETDRIVGLELGADDYIEKPFNPRELLARIKAIRRRTESGSESGASNATRFRLFNGFVLDTVTRELTAPTGGPVSLSGTDYQLLIMLLDASGEILSRESIAGITRGRDNLPMDRFIDVQISRLRSRLGDDARSPTLIKTVRGKGYVFSSNVEARANVASS